jgi:hypothetical protein
LKDFLFKKLKAGQLNLFYDTWDFYESSSFQAVIKFPARNILE